ncbi:MAG: fused DSP-PTPase phosphatase/NAD kinase-like protein [Bacteroidales bacterium]
MQSNVRGVCRYAATVLISLALPAYAAAQIAPAAGNGTTNQVALSAIRIDNFGRVDATYYRGAQPRGKDYADLAALGVRTVIDLTKDGDPAEAGMAERAGMKFFRIPMTTRETPSADAVSRFLQIVNDPANQPVYVHCQGGRHRTGVMTAVYRMTDDGWTADQAFAEMKRYKFGADFLHPEFKQFVYGFRPVIARADGLRAGIGNAAKPSGANATVDAKAASRR